MGVNACFSGFQIPDEQTSQIKLKQDIPAASMRMLRTRAKVVNISIKRPRVRLVPSPRETFTARLPEVRPWRMADATIAPTNCAMITTAQMYDQQEQAGKRIRRQHTETSDGLDRSDDTKGE